MVRCSGSSCAGWPGSRGRCGGPGGAAPGGGTPRGEGRRGGRGGSRAARAGGGPRGDGVRILWCAVRGAPARTGPRGARRRPGGAAPGGGTPRGEGRRGGRGGSRAARAGGGPRGDGVRILWCAVRGAPARAGPVRGGGAAGRVARRLVGGHLVVKDAEAVAEVPAPLGLEAVPEGTGCGFYGALFGELLRGRALGGRAADRVARRLVGGHLVVKDAEAVAEVPAPLGLEAVPEGTGCGFYGALVGALLRGLARFEGAVRHTRCRSRGDDRCEWRASAVGGYR